MSELVISAALVKELRDQTGVGMIDCKKALAEANGDFDVAQEILKKKGAIKADKKSDRETNNGVVKFSVSNGNVVGVKLLCETDFVSKNEAWLENAIERKKKKFEKYDISDDEKNKLINLAKEYLPGRVDYYSRLMNVKPTGIKITSAKKRFGSCSGKNSICFSYYLMLYPKEAVDYVVVHELAHIRHHNHSKDFYNFVSEFMPDYKEREKLLKTD